MSVNKMVSFLHLATDFMASRSSPGRAAEIMKKMAAEFYSGCNVYVISPGGAGERSFLSADFNMPVEWVRKMADVYGQIALIEPDPLSEGGQEVFSAPFIWILLHFEGEAGSALLVAPSDWDCLDKSQALSVAGELKSFFELAFKSGSFAENTGVGPEEGAADFPAEKEDLIRMLDKAVRDPLNTIIGYSMLLLDGSVAGPLSGLQAEFVQDILDGGYGVLKHIEDFREKNTED